MGVGNQFVSNSAGRRDEDPDLGICQAPHCLYTLHCAWVFPYPTIHALLDVLPVFEETPRPRPQRQLRGLLLQRPFSYVVLVHDGRDDEVGVGAAWGGCATGPG